MTFADAAIAYQLVQSGCSLRLVAPQFGVSRTHLSRTIASCLEHGRASPYINATHAGRPRALGVKTVKAGMVLLDRGMTWHQAAKVLKVDAEKLRRAAWHFDNRAPVLGPRT